MPRHPPCALHSLSPNKHNNKNYKDARVHYTKLKQQTHPATNHPPQGTTSHDEAHKTPNPAPPNPPTTTQAADRPGSTRARCLRTQQCMTPTPTPHPPHKAGHTGQEQRTSTIPLGKQPPPPPRTGRTARTDHHPPTTPDPHPQPPTKPGDRRQEPDKQESDAR
jgi:hypothetical protein